VHRITLLVKALVRITVRVVELTECGGDLPSELAFLRFTCQTLIVHERHDVVVNPVQLFRDARDLRHARRVLLANRFFQNHLVLNRLLAFLFRALLKRIHLVIFLTNNVRITQRGFVSLVQDLSDGKKSG
jgi:hypothetical protein